MQQNVALSSQLTAKSKSLSFSRRIHRIDNRANRAAISKLTFKYGFKIGTKERRATCLVDLRKFKFFCVEVLHEGSTGSRKDLGKKFFFSSETSSIRENLSMFYYLEHLLWCWRNHIIFERIPVVCSSLRDFPTSENFSICLFSSRTRPPINLPQFSVILESRDSSDRNICCALVNICRNNICCKLV